MGFKEYSKNTQTNEKSFSNEETKNIENLYNKYKDQPEDQLINELLNTIAKQKKEGTFNYDALKSIIEKISPFLSKEQNLKIKEILYINKN